MSAQGVVMANISRLAHQLAIFNWPISTMSDMIHNLLMIEDRAIRTDAIGGLFIKHFGIEVPEQSIKSTLDKLLSQRSVMKLGSEISLSYETKDKIKEHLQLRRELENNVLSSWAESSLSKYELTSDEKTQLVDGLRVFINTLFFRQGVESMTYLKNQDVIYGDADIVSVLNEMNWTSEKLEQIGRTEFCGFLTLKDTNSINYLHSQMQTAICYLTNVFDQEFILNLKKHLEKKCLYLDSSVVYRFLGLQGEARKNSVRTAMDLCRSFGMKLCVNAITFKELKRRIKFDSNILRKYPIATNLAAVGVKYLSEENFVSTYWDHASKCGVNVEDFIAPFTQLDVLLKGHNIVVETNVRELSTDLENRSKEIESKLRQEDFPNAESDYQKSNSAYEHDAYCLALLEAMRGEVSSFIDSPAWFITTDRSLIRFQKNDPLFKDFPPVAILPSQLIGILGFTHPASTSYSEAFLSFFSNAFVPAQTIVSNDMIQEILGRIGYYNGSVTLADMILSDQMLLKRIAGCQEPGEREEVIHDSLIKRAEELSNNLKEKTDQIEILESTNRKLVEDYSIQNKEKNTIEEKNQAINEKLLVAQRRLLEEKQKKATIERELELEKRKVEAAEKEKERIIGAVKVIFTGVLGTCPLLYQIYTGNWSELELVIQAGCIGSMLVFFGGGIYWADTHNSFERFRTWLTLAAATIGISVFVATVLKTMG